MTDKRCRQCGKPVPRTRAEFCDRACFAAFHAAPEVRCVECGGVIPHRPGGRERDAKFCGNPCKFAYQKRNPSRPRKPRVTVPCATCGASVSFLPSQRGSYREGRSDNIYCSRRCKGAGHSLIMTGRRPSNGTYSSQNTFRSMARREFFDRCAVCDWSEAPCDVAHIVARKRGGENVLENVTMLCPNHHRMYDLGLLPEQLIRETRPGILRA